MALQEASTSNTNVQEGIREEEPEDVNETETLHKLHLLR